MPLHRIGSILVDHTTCWCYSKINQFFLCFSMSSRINGSNTSVDLLRREPPKVAIHVWKGTKKKDITYTDKKTKEVKQGKGFGSQLPFEYRLDLFHNKPQSEVSEKVKLAVNPIKIVLKRTYGENYREDNAGNIYLSRINIVFYNDCPLRTYYSAMGLYKNGKTVHHCDKKIIHTKFDPETRRPYECDQPCKARHTQATCPLGCKDFGILYFEIFELVMAGIKAACRMYVTGKNDVPIIASYLDDFAAEIGDLKNCSFYSSRTERNVVFVLDKQQVVNQFNKYNYLVQLYYYSVWKKQFDSKITCDQLVEMGLPVPSDLVNDIYGDALIPQHIKTIDPKPNRVKNFQVSDVPLSDRDIDLARRTWRNQGWYQEGLMYLLRSTFNISRRDEIKNMSRQNFDKFLIMLHDRETKKNFNIKEEQF